MIIILTSLFLIGCPLNAQGQVENYFIGKDRQSPVLYSLETVDERTVLAVFDETIYSCEAYGEENLSIDSRPDERTVFMTLTERLLPGDVCPITLSVADRAGNTTTVETEVSGINTRVPRLRLNEISTKGTKSQPDRIELYIMSDGDMAGITVYDGMYLNNSGRFTFPPYEVKKGDYIVLQYGVKENIHFHPHFFFASAEGLGGNNGVISVFQDIGRDLIDALPYSDRDDDSDTDYGGFGTSEVYEEVRELESYHVWEPPFISPSTSVRSDDTTATRSMNRKEGVQAGNSADAWYTVPTSSSTFGKENCVDQYRESR